MKPYRLRTVAVTASTNEDIKKAAAAGEPEGLAIFARKQIAGKGRSGRTGELPEGNLHLSILLRPGCDARQAAQHGFAAALAIRDLVQEFLPNAEVKLKWPNDVLVDGKKISGILLESSSSGENVDWIVAGIGLNVVHHPADALFPASSLHALGAPRKADDILEPLLEKFFAYAETLKIKGFSPLRQAWLDHAQKGKMGVRTPQRAISGEFAGLDEHGNLQLDLADGTQQTISAGDVFF